MRSLPAARIVRAPQPSQYLSSSFSWGGFCASLFCTSGVMVFSVGLAEKKKALRRERIASAFGTGLVGFTKACWFYLVGNASGLKPQEFPVLDGTAEAVP